MEYESETLETIEPEHTNLCGSGRKDRNHVHRERGYGRHTAQLWKIVTENGEEISREVVNYSYYLATDRVVAVGTASDDAEETAQMEEAVNTQNEETITAAINRITEKRRPEGKRWEYRMEKMQTAAEKQRRRQMKPGNITQDGLEPVCEETTSYRNAAFGFSSVSGRKLFRPARGFGRFRCLEQRFRYRGSPRTVWYAALQAAGKSRGPGGVMPQGGVTADSVSGGKRKKRCLRRQQVRRRKSAAGWEQNLPVCRER